MSEVTGLTVAESTTKLRPSRGAAALAFVVAILAAALGSWADAAASRAHLGQGGAARLCATTTDLEVRPSPDTSSADIEAGEPWAVSQLPGAAASLREDHCGDVPKSGLSRGAQLRQQYAGRFDEYMRFRGQGLGRTASEAKWLMQAYENGRRMGHHFPVSRQLAGQWGFSVLT